MPAVVLDTPIAQVLAPSDTVETTDLFNNLDRIIITNCEVDDYWRERRRVDAPAHNPRPRAPEHLSMLNNLLGDRARQNALPPPVLLP